MIRELRELREMVGQEIPDSGIFSNDQLEIPTGMNVDKLQDLIAELVNLKLEQEKLEKIRGK